MDLSTDHHVVVSWIIWWLGCQTDLVKPNRGLGSLGHEIKWATFKTFLAEVAVRGCDQKIIGTCRDSNPRRKKEI